MINRFLNLLFHYFIKVNYFLPIPDRGDCIKLDVVAVGQNAFNPIDIVDREQPDCCSVDELMVFADLFTDSELKNDKNSFRYKGNQTLISDITMTLQKFVNGVWTDMIVLDAAANLGTFLDYGHIFSFGSNIDEDDNKYTSYELEWKKVLLGVGLGVGSYRVKAVQTGVGAATTYSFEYCLNEWSKNLADGTVLIEAVFTGKVGEKIINAIPETWEFIDYGDEDTWINLGKQGWYNSIRIKGFFGDNNSELENEFTQYSDEEGSEKVWISTTRKPMYKLNRMQLSYTLRHLIEFHFLMADKIWITDYNKYNANVNIKVQVNPKGGFKPDYTGGTVLATLEHEFENAHNNKRKKRC